MLLEVVLALLLFVAAVAVVSSAMNSAMASVERQRLSLHAANLAFSVHAELDLGLRASELLGPEAFGPPFDEWTWQLASSSLENPSGGASGSSDDGGLTMIEVVIRNTNSPVVYRLAQTHRVVKTVTLTTNSEPAAVEEPGL